MSKFSWLEYALSEYAVRRSDAADIIEISLEAGKENHEGLIRFGLNLLEESLSVETVKNALRNTISELDEFQS